MKFGGHLSIKDGYFGAAKRALAINAAAFQYFPKNPKSLVMKAFNKEDARKCKEFCEANKLISVSHSPYPTTLTPLTKKRRNEVIASLLNDLEIAEACGSIGVVVHFGKQISRTNPLASYQLIIEMLNEILQSWSGEAKILLENNAGLPGSIGTTLEELTQVRKLCSYPEKIGFCFDTCHAFSSGVWDGENWKILLEKGLKLGYFAELKLVHLNNSKYETRSGKDRHAPIFGHGYIREGQFDHIMKTSQLIDIPFILETPKEEIPREEEINQLLTRWGGQK
ncbi:deoxyribonuclease IV [Bacillus sp. FJAT-50079]|nr:deoxyribonuclease IV [Bacillus sp. FJAT-50079]